MYQDRRRGLGRDVDVRGTHSLSRAKICESQEIESGGYCLSMSYASLFLTIAIADTRSSWKSLYRFCGIRLWFCLIIARYLFWLACIDGFHFLFSFRIFSRWVSSAHVGQRPSRRNMASIIFFLHLCILISDFGSRFFESYAFIIQDRVAEICSDYCDIEINPDWWFSR